MRKVLLYFIFCFTILHLKAQTQIASPQIINYNSEEYNGGVQNWDVAQDNNGIVYFGNNDGLISFNGSFWNVYRLPNYTVIRSVEIDKKNRIFVGGQDEIGYFFPDKNGVLKYHSLVHLIPEKDRKFADIWHLVINNEEVFFQSTNVIIHYKDGVVKTYKPEMEWEFIGSANNQLFAHSRSNGLMIYDEGVWKPYNQDPVLNNSSITSIMEYRNDTLLVSTLKNGLFLLHQNKLFKKKTEIDEVFYNDRIYFSKKINEDWYALGTTSAGLFIIDKNGKLIQKYAYKDGLQNNNIRSIITDKTKNLWLALDDGIDYIAINSGVKIIHPDKNKQITSYAFRVFDKRLYIGSSNGLYVSNIDNDRDISLSKNTFNEVKNVKGQVWNLEEINGKLLMGHEDGFFLLDKEIARQIYTVPGTWIFQPTSSVFPSPTIIAGTYLGLQKIGFNEGNFINEGNISGIKESLRFMVFDNNHTLWASHPYRGVFRIELEGDYKKIKKYTIYTHKDGLPSSLYNYVYKIKNRVVVATENGVYEYNEKQNNFTSFALLNDALKGISIQYLKEDKDGNVWFVNNKKVGVVDFNHPVGDKTFSIIYLPQLDGKVVGGFESIYPLNNENIFIGSNKGAYHINYKKVLENFNKPEVLIGSVKIFGKNDSTIFGGYFFKDNQVIAKQDPSSVLELSKEYSSIHFEYASTLFEQQKNIQFSVQLKGFDKEWSVWTSKTEKEYTNLSPGKYSFQVKARNGLGNESEYASYTFIVLPAWYQSYLMYFLYVILIVIGLFLFFRWQQKKYLKAQNKLSYLHQLELDRNEKEIVRLKYEKLEADVDYKNRELSTMTMHLVQRGEVLSKIKEVISTIIKNHDINDSSPSFRHLIRLIRDVEKTDEDWEQFSLHFNNVNTDFFNKLKDHFPDITPNELKLCAYLKMNLSSKEIAQLMNITIKAVEVGRYRLRKKLHLQPEMNLYEFLIQVSRI